MWAREWGEVQPKANLNIPQLETAQCSTRRWISRQSLATGYSYFPSLSLPGFIFSSLLFRPFSPSSQTGRHMSNEKGGEKYSSQISQGDREGRRGREIGGKQKHASFLSPSFSHFLTHTPSSRAHSSFSPCYQLLKLQVKYESSADLHPPFLPPLPHKLSPTHSLYGCPREGKYHEWIHWLQGKVRQCKQQQGATCWPVTSSQRHEILWLWFQELNLVPTCYYKDLEHHSRVKVVRRLLSLTISLSHFKYLSFKYITLALKTTSFKLAKK